MQRNNRLVWDETINIVKELSDDVWRGKNEVTMDNIVDLTVPVRNLPIPCAPSDAAMVCADRALRYRRGRLRPPHVVGRGLHGTCGPFDAVQGVFSPCATRKKRPERTCIRLILIGCTSPRFESPVDEGSAPGLVPALRADPPRAEVSHRVRRPRGMLLLYALTG